MSLVSGIWRRVADSALNFEQQVELAREIWRRANADDPIVLWPRLIDSETDRQLLHMLATRQYGARAKRKAR